MIRRIILHLLANAAALYFISLFLNGDFIITGGIKGYLLAALLFAFINSLVKPILKILSLPFMLITAGLFSFVLNMTVLWLVEYSLNTLAVDGIAMELMNLPTYLYVSLLVSIANLMIHWLAHK